jgi:hypothetical protein
MLTPPRRRVILWTLLCSPLLWCSVCGMLWPKYCADQGGFNSERPGLIKRRRYETLPIDMLKSATTGLLIGAGVDALITSVRKRLAWKPKDG